jgi:hypothetical protein
MPSTTRSKLRTGLAVALTLTVGAAGPALVAETAAAAQQPSKTERLLPKAGKQGQPSKQSVKAVKRALKRAGVKRAGAPKKAATKKMNRAICDIYYYWDGAIGVCLNVGGPTGFFNTVFFDSYFDNAGWIYYGWAYA